MLGKFKLSSDTIYFAVLIGLLLFLFQGAFRIKFFQDDFYYISLSQANSASELIYFLNPFREVFYRPIPSEFFYFLLSSLNYNHLIGHGIVFLTFFVGLIFLFKTVFSITNSKGLAYLTVFLYSVNLTHVFQLYWFATFQEICLFTFLTISFYAFVKTRILLSLVFFIFALLSKETAILFPLIPICYLILKDRSRLIISLPYIFLSLISLFIYKTGISNVEQIEIYRIQFNPSLIANNFVWYSLWSAGFPNFLPNYVKSIFLQPLPDFWNLMRAEEIKHYLYSLIAYLSLLSTAAIFYLLTNKNQIKRLVLVTIACFAFFALFVLPTLPIIHKWMVRLTVPLIFVAFFQAYILYLFYYSKKRVFGFLAILLIALYTYSNIIGIRVHESSGLFELENKVVNNAQRIFIKENKRILESGVIYFSDENSQAWGGSKKLKNTFHNQDFLAYFFPNQKIKAIYGFEASPPSNAVILRSADFYQ